MFMRIFCDEMLYSKRDFFVAHYCKCKTRKDSVSRWHYVGYNSISFTFDLQYILNKLDDIHEHKDCICEYITYMGQKYDTSIDEQFYRFRHILIADYLLEKFKYELP